MEKVLRYEGERKGSYWFYYKGYTYHRDTRCYEDFMIIRCSHRGDTGCTANLRINDALEIVDYTQIIHDKCGEPLDYIPALEEFKNELVKKSKESFKKLRVIYNECVESKPEYVHCK